MPGDGRPCPGEPSLRRRAKPPTLNPSFVLRSSLLHIYNPVVRGGVRLGEAMRCEAIAMAFLFDSLRLVKFGLLVLSI